MMIYKANLIGTVTYFSPIRGFGFITEWVLEGKKPRQFFFHISAVRDQVVLSADDIVIFQIGPSPKRGGQIIACMVRLSKKAEMPSQLQQCFLKNGSLPPQDTEIPAALSEKAAV